MGDEAIELKKVALRYIKTHNTMTIATCANNIPWAADVFYASDGFILYFISNPKVALHCKNIALNPKVSIAISEDYKLRSIRGWRKIKGIQMEGEAEVLEDREDVEKAFRVYTKKFPFTAFYLKKLFSYGEETLFEKLLVKFRILPPFTPSKDNRFFKVKPKKVWLVDNERSFERRLEIPI